MRGRAAKEHHRYRLFTPEEIERAQQAHVGLRVNAVDREGKPEEGSVSCGACDHALAKNSVAQTVYCGSRRFMVGTARPVMCDRFEGKA